MAKERTRADILREIADLEDELREHDRYYCDCQLRERRNITKLGYEFSQDKIFDLQKKLAGVRKNDCANMKAYEYHVVSDTELDFDKILLYGIKGIAL